MQTELDALRLLLAKEHSFSPERRYLSAGHDQMVPLLIYFNTYFVTYHRGMSQESKKRIRLDIVNKICESNITSFYQMTSWQLSTITNFLETLNTEHEGKANEFLDFVANET